MNWIRNLLKIFQFMLLQFNSYNEHWERFVIEKCLPFFSGNKSEILGYSKLLDQYRVLGAVWGIFPSSSPTFLQGGEPKFSQVSCQKQTNNGLAHSRHSDISWNPNVLAVNYASIIWIKAKMASRLRKRERAADFVRAKIAPKNNWHIVWVNLKT